MKDQFKQNTEREVNDYYATPKRAVIDLLDRIKFNDYILEPAVGEGHIDKILKDHGYITYYSDIVHRGYEGTIEVDFLKADMIGLDVDIVTNPPYRLAQEFIVKSLDVILTGNKVAMLLPLTFLESIKRKQFFEDYPPKYVYVFSKRIACGINGKFTKWNDKKQKEVPLSSTTCYAWFIYVKGYSGDTIVKWI